MGIMCNGRLGWRCAAEEEVLLTPQPESTLSCEEQIDDLSWELLLRLSLASVSPMGGEGFRVGILGAISIASSDMSLTSCC